MSSRGRAVTSTERLKIVGAFAAVYVIWGTSYLATAIAVRTVSPLQLVCVRGLIGGACLAAWQFLKRAPAPVADWRQIGWIIVTGIVLLVGGHGLLFLGQRTAASGISAVMLATIPLWMMVLDVLCCGRSTNKKAVAGVMLGITGVALLVILRSGGKASLTLREAAIFLSAAGLWAAASLVTARRLNNVSAVPRATGQLFAGGLVAGLLSFAFSDPIVHPDWIIVIAILYLGIASSAFTFCAYNWLLTRTSPTAAGTYAFVNPVIALLVWSIFAGEIITLPAFVASSVILFSVALVLVGAGGLGTAAGKAAPPHLASAPAVHGRD